MTVCGTWASDLAVPIVSLKAIPFVGAGDDQGNWGGWMQKISLKAQEQPCASTGAWPAEVAVAGVQNDLRERRTQRRLFSKVKKDEGADPLKIKVCKIRDVELFCQILTSNQHPNLGPFCCITL